MGRVFCTLYPSGKNLCSVELPVSNPWALNRPGRAKGPGGPFSPLYRSKNPPGPKRRTTGQNRAHIPFTRRAMRGEKLSYNQSPVPNRMPRLRSTTTQVGPPVDGGAREDARGRILQSPRTQGAKPYSDGAEYYYFFPAFTEWPDGQVCYSSQAQTEKLCLPHTPGGAPDIHSKYFHCAHLIGTPFLGTYCFD